MSLLSPLGGSGRPRKGDLAMRSPFVLLLLIDDEEEEEEDSCFVLLLPAEVVVVVLAPPLVEVEGGGFPGALTTYETHDGIRTYAVTSYREKLKSPCFSSWYVT